MSETALAALGLGGNVGDVRKAMREGLAVLAATPGIETVKTSSLYRTAPWGPVAQPPFLNRAAIIRTWLSPHQLLDACLETESTQGRVRGERFGPRTLDIDILVFGEVTIADERLILPHPRLLERAFALVPLAEIAPDLMIGEVSAAAAARRLGTEGIERLQDTPT